jgi:hypothetical protein
LQQAPVRAIINARATKNLLFHSYARSRKAQVEIAAPINKPPILLLISLWVILTNLSLPNNLAYK